MKLDEALGWFYLSMSGVVSEATVTFYRRRLPSLIAHLGDVDIDTITINQLRAWRADLATRKDRYANHPRRNTKAGGLSPHTLHQYVRACRRFFKWLTEEGYIDHSPAARLELPPIPRSPRRGISRADRDSILAAAKANGPRDFALVRFLSDTGCRVAGLAGLVLAELDLDHRRAIVHEKGLGGNGKGRVVFYHAITADALRAWLKERANLPYKGVQVFIGKGIGKHQAKGWQPMTENGVYNVIRRLAKTAKIDHNGWNPHNWRHGTIRNWLNNGMPLSKASQLAGHSSTRVTGDIYGTSNDDELQQAHDKWSSTD